MSEAEIATIDLELEKELEAGTTTKKVRKTPAKNKMNGTKTMASNTAQVEEEEDESDEEERERDVNLKRKKGGTATDNNGEDNMPPLKKKKAARKQPQKKGKAVTKPSKRSNITQKLPAWSISKEFLNTIVNSLIITCIYMS